MTQSTKWEAPSHLSLGDVQFLSDREETIKNIQAASALLQGRVLLQVKRRFASDKKLDDWFYPWAIEAAGVSKTVVYAMIGCAEVSEQDPRIEEALNSNAAQAIQRAFGLPKSVRDQILDRMVSGERITQQKLCDLGKLPEVELESAEEAVDKLEDLLSTWKLRYLSAEPGREKNKANSGVISTNKRLDKAKQRLAELREKNASLEVKMTAQEAVMYQLNRQLKEHQVRYEQATQDPADFAARSEAKAVVEAEKAITDALLSLERIADGYGTMSHDQRKALQLKLDKLHNVITALNTEART